MKDLSSSDPLRAGFQLVLESFFKIFNFNAKRSLAEKNVPNVGGINSKRTVKKVRIRKVLACPSQISFSSSEVAQVPFIAIKSRSPDSEQEQLVKFSFKVLFLVHKLSKIGPGRPVQKPVSKIVDRLEDRSLFSREPV